MLGRNVRSQQVQIGLTGFPISQWNIKTDNTFAEATTSGFLTPSYQLGNYYKDGDFALVNTTDKGTVYLQILADNVSNVYSLVEPQLTKFVESTVLAGSAIALTTAISANITSITLTAGEWDVYGNVCYAAAAGTIPTFLSCAISTTSATLPTLPNSGGSSQLSATFGSESINVLSVGSRRINVSSNAVIYLVANSTFTVSTMGAYGYIGARRVGPYVA